MNPRDVSGHQFGLLVVLGILAILQQSQVIGPYHAGIRSSALSFEGKSQQQGGRGGATASCALLFFGAPRLFRRVLPSIREHVLGANPGCDVYAHTYNITSSPSGRNFTETPGSADYREVLELTRHTLVHSLADFEAAHGADLPFYRAHHHALWGDCCISTENMIKQWHSINSVWEYAQSFGKDYDRVGLFRLDAVYPHPIPISSPSSADAAAVVPRFLWNGKTSFGNLSLANDRMFYGDKKHAEVWATKRFEYSRLYTTRFADEPEGSRLQGLHSESMLAHLLEHYGVPLTKKDVCFWRVRTSGYLTTYDCRVAGAPPGQILADPSVAPLLDGFDCCNDCNSARLEPHPCFPSKSTKHASGWAKYAGLG